MSNMTIVFTGVTTNLVFRAEGSALAIASSNSPEIVLTFLPVYQVAPSSGATYAHTQSAAATTWTVNHNLGFKPNTSVQSVGGVEILTQVLHVSVNQLLVLFDEPFSGFAFCS